MLFLKIFRHQVQLKQPGQYGVFAIDAAWTLNGKEDNQEQGGLPVGTVIGNDADAIWRIIHGSRISCDEDVGLEIQCDAQATNIADKRWKQNP